MKISGATSEAVNGISCTRNYGWITKNIFKDFPTDNYVVITCEVDAWINGKESLLTNLPVEPTTAQNNLTAKYLTLLKTGHYSDVTLCVGKEKFKVHRGILALNCEYFEVMFKDVFKESTDKEIEIKDVDPRIFKIILEFIYTQQLPEDLTPIVKDLLVAADKFCLQPVVEKCKNKLCGSISLENCVELLILADTFNQTELKRALISFIKYNIRHVVISDPWKELKKINCKLALEAMEGTVG